MILDGTAKVLRVVLGEAHTTNPCTSVAAFADTVSGSTFVPGEQDAASNGTTPVNVVSAPAASTQRHVKSLHVFNADTVTHSVFVQFYDGSNVRNLIHAALDVNEALVWTQENGWSVEPGDVNLSGFTTDDLTEGSVNLYFTNERAQDAVGAMVDSTIVYVDGTPLLTRGHITGDIDIPQASNTSTLATVNANVGPFGSATQVVQVTVNAKGLTTAAANVAIAIPSTQVTDFNEAAQDAVGGILTDTATIDLAYNDGANTITANLLSLTGFDTDDLTEGSTNLYYTDVRAQGAISVTDSSEIDFSYSTGAISGSLKNDSVVVGRIHFTATARLLGRTTASAGAGEEISVGSNLTLSGGVLDASLTGLAGTFLKLDASNSPLTGNLSISKSTPVLTLDTGNAAERASLKFNRNGVARWETFKGNAAESGANAGSNYFIQAYDDSGVLLTTPLTISRATGNITLLNTVIAAGAAATPSLAFTGALTTGLFSDTTNTALGISVAGGQTGWFTATDLVIQRPAGGGGNSRLFVKGEGNTNNNVQRYSANATSAQYVIYKSRGTIASPAAVIQGDDLGRWITSGRGATVDVSAAQWRYEIREPTPSDTAFGTRALLESCPIGSATLTELLRAEHATGLSMFGANPVINQDRTHVLRSYTTASPPTLVTGGLTFDSTYNAPVYGGAAALRLIGSGHPLVTTPTPRKLISRLSIVPSINLERLIQDIYARLIAAGLTSKLKHLTVYADPYGEFAAADGLFNWITPGTNDATITGSVTYTAGQGRTGDGSTGFISTVGQAINTYGAAIDDIAYGVDIRTANSTKKAIIGTNTGTRRQILQIGNSSTVTSRVSDSTDDTYTPSKYTGLFQHWRSVDTGSSTGYKRSLDGAAGSTITRTSTAFPSATTVLLFLATNDSTASEFSDGQIRLGFVATGWTDADAAALYSIFQFWWGAKDGLTVAGLPLSANLGDRMMVTDALAATFGTAPTGGGSVKTPTFWNGSAWIMG